MPIRGRTDVNYVSHNPLIIIATPCVNQLGLIGMQLPAKDVNQLELTGMQFSPKDHSPKDGNPSWTEANSLLPSLCTKLLCRENHPLNNLSTTTLQQVANSTINTAAQPHDETILGQSIANPVLAVSHSLRLSSFMKLFCRESPSTQYPRTTPPHTTEHLKINENKTIKRGRGNPTNFSNGGLGVWESRGSRGGGTPP